MSALSPELPATSLGLMRPVPQSVPPAVRDEVDRAAARVDELAASDRQLNFTSDPLTGRLIVEVRDLQGTVIRVISGVEALDVMSGLTDV